MASGFRIGFPDAAIQVGYIKRSADVPPSGAVVARGLGSGGSKFNTAGRKALRCPQSLTRQRSGVRWFKVQCCRKKAPWCLQSLARQH